jgi:small subunit ribosomal protein S13
MVYLFNTNLENKKKVKTALKNIYGIGEKLACQICDKIGISDSLRIKQLTNFQLEKLAVLINQNNLLGPELKQQKRKNIQRLIKIASYRGFRHTEGLPCRGQRTHGNARTARRIKTIILPSRLGG